MKVYKIFVAEFTGTLDKQSLLGKAERVGVVTTDDDKKCHKF